MTALKQKKFAKIYIDEQFQNDLKEIIQNIESGPADRPVNDFSVGKLIGLIYWLTRVEVTEDS